MTKAAWTGSPFMNQRNRTTCDWRSGVVNHDILLDDAFILLSQGNPGTWKCCVIHTGERGDRAVVIGLVSPDVFFVIKDTLIRFTAWDFATASVGSTGWRVAYFFKVDLTKMTFSVDRIDVAPDQDDGSEPPPLPA
jgi:hypothetical protein